MDGQHFYIFFRGTGDFSIYYGAGNNYRGDGQFQYVRTISICTDNFNMYVGGEGKGHGSPLYTQRRKKMCTLGGGGERARITTILEKY